MGTVRYRRLQRLQSGYSRVVTVGYSRLQQVTEWLQWVTAGYSSLQVTEWLQRVKTGCSRLPSGYSGLQLVTAG